MGTMSQQKIQRMIWTGAFAAVTVAGTWYGASLKISQEVQQVTRKVRDATPEEKIGQLEEVRMGLVTQRTAIEKKIGDLDRRRNGVAREEGALGRERKGSW